MFTSNKKRLDVINSVIKQMCKNTVYKMQALNTLN